MVYFKRAFLRLQRAISNNPRNNQRERDVLDAVAVVPLHDHDLLRNSDTLLGSHEAEEAACTRVGLLVTVCNTHATASSNVEARKLAISTNDSDEADVVSKDVYVVRGRNGDSDLKL